MQDLDLNPNIFSKLGRPSAEVDMEAALDMLLKDIPVPAIATELGISAPTLRKRIADIQQKQGLLLQYRSIQSLQLTELQARVLEAITPEKINEAPLRDLVASFKILKDKELVIEGKPSEIKGLVAHLIYLEKQERALAAGEQIPLDEFEDAEFNDELNESPGTLADVDDQVF
jgi:DNA-binding Lrp family transcriptional regulator